MQNKYNEIFSRNIGIFTKDEQKKLKNTTMAVAGVGGVGGLLAERLVRLGVGNIKITDLGTFEASNLNRQFGSTMLNLDMYKAGVVYEEIKKINPESKIEYNNSGIESEDDANRLVDGCDLVIDEMDYGAWRESILLQRAARKKGIYYIFSGAVGFGALLANFDPQGITLEEYNRLPENMDLNNKEVIFVAAERMLPVMPSYTDRTMSSDMMREIIAGKRPVPTCSIGAGLASILAANEAANIILGRKEIVKAPEYIYVDLLDQKFIIGILS